MREGNLSSHLFGKEKSEAPRAYQSAQQAEMEDALEHPVYPRSLDHVQTPEEFVETISFDTINTIFDELVQKSGAAGKVSNTSIRITAESVSFLEKLQDEKNVEGSEIRALSNVPSGKIELKWVSEKGPRTVLDNLKSLRDLMHESAHIRGGYKEEKWHNDQEVGGDFETGFTHRIGVKETRYSSITGTEKVGTSLNEAITEKIGIQVFVEYLNRVGDGGYLKDPEVYNNLKTFGYVADRLALDILIDSLAINLSIPTDQIWKGFVQAYMSGNLELQQLLADMEGEIGATPGTEVLLEGLSGSELMAVNEKFSLNTLLNQVADPGQNESAAEKSLAFTKRIQALKAVTDAVEAERFKNALGLR